MCGPHDANRDERVDEITRLPGPERESVEGIVALHPAKRLHQWREPPYRRHATRPVKHQDEVRTNKRSSHREGPTRSGSHRPSRSGDTRTRCARSMTAIATSSGTNSNGRANNGGHMNRTRPGATSIRPRPPRRNTSSRPAKEVIPPARTSSMPMHVPRATERTGTAAFRATDEARRRLSVRRRLRFARRASLSPRGRRPALVPDSGSGLRYCEGGAAVDPGPAIRSDVRLASHRRSRAPGPRDPRHR